MDASQSNDPFRGEGHGELADAAPEEAPVQLTFDEARWRRVGATDDQVTSLRERWDAYSDEEKTNEDAWLKATPDPEVAAYLNPQQASATGGDGQQAGDGQQPQADPQAGAPVAQNAPEHENAQVAETVAPVTPDAQTGAVTPPAEQTVPGPDGNPVPVSVQPPAEGQQPVGTGGDSEQQPQGGVQTQEPVVYTAADVPDDLPNAKAVEDWVGEDKAKARAALEKENAGEQRKGLTAHLERILGE